VPQEIQPTNWRIAGDDIPAQPNNFEDVPGTYPVLNDSWRFLDIGRQMAREVNADVLVVNQPTMVIDDGPHADLSYSKLYGRAFYDAYHQTLASYAEEHDFWYLDLWRLVSPDHYTDSELHMDGEGWRIVAEALASAIRPQYS
jgi:hypothetical protein